VGNVLAKSRRRTHHRDSRFFAIGKVFFTEIPGCGGEIAGCNGKNRVFFHLWQALENKRFGRGAEGSKAPGSKLKTALFPHFTPTRSDEVSTSNQALYE
jgi:hypothetical protein